ncbi:hypothetical protein IEQ34_007914 [Dendrobium chrysotoxum]|uniref:Uncharacterized protein n=1 Tax=Dendrobium chrysotoxum TaxID=161865 RepID=A0AAV7H355_DENCH|nr:hypothetical protein IEQ34_007914 [Dendrobium chrysotoxum]
MFNSPKLSYYRCLTGARRPHLYLDPLVCFLSELAYSPILGGAIGQVDVEVLETVGPPHGVYRPPRPLCRRCIPGLNWPGRASGAVTLKKLECSKQAHALDTLAWDNTTLFRSYCVGLRDRSND